MASRCISICLVVIFLTAFGSSSFVASSNNVTSTFDSRLSASLSSPSATIGKWRAGWDVLNEPLNYSTSSVTWTASSTTHQLAIRYTLIGAQPNKVYQVGVHIFCTTHAATFGQFPIHSDAGGGICATHTRQGITRTLVNVELGVVRTDVHGNGTFEICVSSILPGTYHIEFDVRNGAGCEVQGGNGTCDVAFQSPGPFGTITTITV